MKKLAVALMGLVLCGQAWADDWRSVGYSDENVMYVDFDKISKVAISVNELTSKTYLNMLVKYEHLPNSSAAKKNLYSTLVQYFVSCDGYIFLNSYINYDKSGRAIKTWKSQKSILSPADFDYAFAGTMIEGAIQATCKYHKTGEKPLKRFLSREEIEKVLPQLNQ